MASILKIFRRKKSIPLACAITLENEEGHVHTNACFLDIQPLSVVELFQSQGCASCPPTTPKILEATQNPNLLLLSYDVTYFDHTGWADTFANKKWDNRQRAYLKKWGRNTIYTPNVIADGVADGTGGGENELHDIVAKSRELRTQMPFHIIVDTNETELRIDSDSMEVGIFDVCLVNYDPKVEIVKVKKGPNKGKKITHRSLVKDIIKIGEWNGGNVTIPMPDMSKMAGTGLETVAIVQGAMGGPIVAAQKV